MNVVNEVVGDGKQRRDLVVSGDERSRIGRVRDEVPVQDTAQQRESFVGVEGEFVEVVHGNAPFFHGNAPFLPQE